MTFQERYQYNPQTDLLGKGGFARVYKAKDVLLDREVAIKIFNASDQNHYSVVEEIKKVIKLEHPNLLRYYDVAILDSANPLGEKESLQIGIMEYANAGDLNQYAQRNPNSPKLFALLQQVLYGLEYLHNNGIIHRDLKPQNILLIERNGELTAKISDFGISKNMDSGTNSASMAIGTIEYMAPEQFNPSKYGINNKIGTNVDLWSFGVMVNELLTDSPLFGQRNGNTTAEQIMSAILSYEIPEGIDNLPEPYKSTVKLCLIKDAKERVQKANELIKLLNKVNKKEVKNNETTILNSKIDLEEKRTKVLSNFENNKTQILPNKPINNNNKDNTSQPRYQDAKNNNNGGKISSTHLGLFYFSLIVVILIILVNMSQNQNNVDDSPSSDTTAVEAVDTAMVDSTAIGTVYDTVTAAPVEVTTQVEEAAPIEKKVINMDVTFNNKSSGNLSLAVAYYDSNKGSWISDGWYPISQGESMKYPLENYKKSKIYFYAKNENSAEWSGTDSYFCVNNDDNFVTNNEDTCEDKKGFTALDLNRYSSQNLSD